MRVVHAFFAGLFAFAAALQLNDPDPIRWIAIYVVAAIACLLAVLRARAARPLAGGIGLVALIWALTYLPSVIRHGQVLSMFDEWTMRNAEVLENREMFGLLIITGVMIAILVTSRGPRSADRA